MKRRILSAVVAILIVSVQVITFTGCESKISPTGGNVNTEAPNKGNTITDNTDVTASDIIKKIENGDSFQLTMTGYSFDHSQLPLSCYITRKGAWIKFHMDYPSDDSNPDEVYLLNTEETCIYELDLIENSWEKVDVYKGVYDWMMEISTILKDRPNLLGDYDKKTKEYIFEYKNDDEDYTLSYKFENISLDMPNNLPE